MKTKIVNFKHLESMIRTKKDPVMWICGPKYYEELLDLDFELGEQNIHFSYWGTRVILDIPAQIGHEKVQDDEIVLLSRTELQIIKNQEMKKNG